MQMRIFTATTNILSGGAPIMLLRNMDRARGHGNGMRYIVRQVSRWYIEAEIACGEYTGNMLFIRGYHCTVAYGRRHAVYTASSAVKCAGPNADQTRRAARRARLYSRTAVCGGVAMRKSAKLSLFVDNFQTVNVLYEEVLS